MLCCSDVGFTEFVLQIVALRRILFMLWSSGKKNRHLLKNNYGLLCLCVEYLFRSAFETDIGLCRLINDCERSSITPLNGVKENGQHLSRLYRKWVVANKVVLLRGERDG